MKIVYRDYEEKSRQIAGDSPLGIPKDHVIAYGDRVVILRLDSGVDIEVTEDNDGYMMLRSLNSRLGLAPSNGRHVLCVIPFPFKG